MIIQIGIGVVVGVIFGAAAVGILDRRHQNTVEKLVESRRKLERQRTQAVNDLFAFRAEAAAIGPAATGETERLAESNSSLVAEVESLRALVGRADAALSAAKQQRDSQDLEVAQLRGQLEVFTGDRAEVINLHPQQSREYNITYGGVV